MAAATAPLRMAAHEPTRGVGHTAPRPIRRQGNTRRRIRAFARPAPRPRRGALAPAHAPWHRRRLPVPLAPGATPRQPPTPRASTAEKGTSTRAASGYPLPPGPLTARHREARQRSAETDRTASANRVVEPALIMAARRAGCRSTTIAATRPQLDRPAWLTLPGNGSAADPLLTRRWEVWLGWRHQVRWA